MRSDAALLWRATSIVRHRCDIANYGQVEADGLERAHRRLPTGAGAFDANFDFFQSVTHGLTGCVLGNHLSRIGRAFARALKSDFARAGPADDFAGHVSDRDDRIVKRRENVRDPGMDIFAALGLNDLRLLNLVSIERKILGPD